MDQVVWVEILNRQGSIVARHRCAGPEIRIGRGYANDVILDDPFVAPEHLRIARDSDGRLVAEDLGSINGLYVAGGSTRLPRVALDGKHAFRIGHTLLRVRETADGVAPERVAQAIRPGYAIIAVLGLAALGIEALTLWLNETGQPHWSLYAAQLLSLVGMVLAWVAAWATISRIFAGQVNFQRNLFIALAGFFVYVGGIGLIGIAGFALSWHSLATYQFAAVWCFAAALCFAHLREMGPAHLAVKAGSVAALAALAIAGQTLVQFNFTGTGFQRPYVVRLMPPALRLVPAKSEENFFADLAALKRQLDQDREDAVEQP